MKDTIELTIVMPDGSAVQVEASPEALVDDLIDELLDAYSLSRVNATGERCRWRLDHRDTGRPLSNKATLSHSLVSDGDHLALSRTGVGGFPPSARILLANGDSVPMSTIQRGEIVLGFCPPGLDSKQAGTYVPSHVAGVVHDECVELIVLNRSLIVAGDQQLVLANGASKLAQHLVKGDRLLKYPFSEVAIVDIRKERRPTAVLSLELRECECFVVESFVGLAGSGKESQQSSSFDVFLSYSSADKDEARVILEMLTSEQMTVFLSEKSIEAGAVWEGTIREALRKCYSFLILITPNSLRSEWVSTEWGAAWILEKQILPVLFRCRPDELPKRLQSYQCVDFHQIRQCVHSIRKIKEAGLRR